MILTRAKKMRKSAKNNNSKISFYRYVVRSFVPGNRWINRSSLSIITRGLRYREELSLIRSNECFAVFSYNDMYDLVLVDSTNHRYQWELWLSPRNTCFLAKLAYSVKHDQAVSVRTVEDIAALVSIGSKDAVSVRIESGWFSHVINWLDSKRIRTVSDYYDVNLIKSVRNRLDLSRVIREAVLGRTKLNNWDKVSL